MPEAATTNTDGGKGVVAPKLPNGATLPFPPTPSASVAGRTLQESTYAQRVTPPRLHDDPPNIVIVLIDDAGPGLPTTFGGEVRTAAWTGSAPRGSPTTGSTPPPCVRRRGRRC